LTGTILLSVMKKRYQLRESRDRAHVRTVFVSLMSVHPLKNFRLEGLAILFLATGLTGNS